MTDYNKYAYGSDGKMRPEYESGPFGHPELKKGVTEAQALEQRRITVGKAGMLNTPSWPAIPPHQPVQPVAPVAVSVFEKFGIVQPEEKTSIPAHKFLEDASKVMKQRAQLRDKPEGERSMECIVKTFNTLTGKNLTEAEGWEFMLILKMVRGRQGNFNEDDYTDMAAYSGLLGECESKTRK
jgi:hypothetical protein